MMMRTGLMICLGCLCCFIQPVWGYDGPVFDAMAQMGEPAVFLRNIGFVKEAGVAKIALMARSDDVLGKNEQELLALREQFPDLIVLGAPKFSFQGDDIDDDYIQHVVHGIKEYGYRFVGEIPYTHGDKIHGEKTAKGERYLDPLKEGTQKLLKALAGLHVPVMIHWEAYDWERDWPRFDAVFSAYPEQIFIIPHMAFASPERVEEILSKHDNVFMIMAKGFLRKHPSLSDGAKQQKVGPRMRNRSSGALSEKWRPLLMKYSKRILFATDAHKDFRWTLYVGMIRRAWMLDDLPESVAEDILYHNAQRLYLGESAAAEGIQECRP